jgi:prevent-host-death family protein
LRFKTLVAVLQHSCKPHRIPPVSPFFLQPGLCRRKRPGYDPLYGKKGLVMITVSVAQAKARLSALLDKMEAGEEVVITRHGRPVANIAPVTRQKQPLPLEKLATFRARMPHWRKDSASLVREMRDNERH